MALSFKESSHPYRIVALVAPHVSLAHYKKNLQLDNSLAHGYIDMFVIAKLLFRAVGFSYGHAGDSSFDSCSQTKLFSESLKYSKRMVHTRGHLIERTASREVTGIWGRRHGALEKKK